MSNFFKRNLKGDPVVWMIWFLLVCVSIIEMFSASSYLVSSSGSISRPILKHIMLLIVGFGLIIFMQIISVRSLRIFGYLGVLISIFLLIYTLAFGVGNGDATRFIKIGGIQFQPSELARLSLLIFSADLIDRFQKKEIMERYFWCFMVVAYMLIGLILPENLSTAVILGVVLSLMLIVGTIPFKKVLLFCIIPLVIISSVLGVAMIIPRENYTQTENNTKVEKIFYNVFGRAYTWVARIENFVKPDEAENKYSTEENYQFAHAQIAIARGGFFLNMPGSSIQRDYLPEAYSDFIFAIIIEELGLMGGILVILLYLVLLYRAGVVAKRSPTVFSAVLVIGVTLMIVFQAFVHIAVSAGIIPLTGQPLPLISKGGTSIAVTSIYFGIIISLTRSMYNDDGNLKTQTTSASADLQGETEPVPADSEDYQISSNTDNLEEPIDPEQTV